MTVLLLKLAWCSRVTTDAGVTLEAGRELQLDGDGTAEAGRECQSVN